MSDITHKHNLRFKPFKFDSSLNPSDDAFDDDITTCNDIPCRYYTNDNIHTHEPNISNSNLSLIHFNSRSLNKNSNNIINFLSTLHHHFDIYGFSETWFTHDYDAPLVDIGDFVTENCIRQDRRGGGVSLYINSHLNYSNRPDLSINCSDCDSLFIETSLNSTNTIIGIIYKPEYVNYNDFLVQLNNTLDTISNEKKACYIMGDFNLDLLKHDTESKVEDFINTFYSHDFIPSIDRPTRIRPNNIGGISATLIDNIFTNDITTHISSGVIITKKKVKFYLSSLGPLGIPNFFCSFLNSQFFQTQFQDWEFPFF